MRKVLFEKRFGLLDWLIGVAAFAVAGVAAVAIGIEVVQALIIIAGFAVLCAVAFAVLGELALRNEIAVLAEVDGALEATTASMFGRGRTLRLTAEDAAGLHYDPLWPGHPNWGPMQIRFLHEGRVYRLGLANAATLDREGIRRWLPDSFADDSHLSKVVTAE